MTEIVLLYKLPVYVTVDVAKQRVLVVECFEGEIEPYREGEVLCPGDEAGDEARRAAAFASDAPWPHARLTCDGCSNANANAPTEKL